MTVATKFIPHKSVLFRKTTELPVIVFDPAFGFVTFSGILECNGAVVSNGYVGVSFGTSQRYLPVDENGFFSETISVCSATEVSILGYELDELGQGVEVSYDITNLTELELGTLQVCQEELDEYLSIVIGEEAFFLPEVLLIAVNQTQLFVYADDIGSDGVSLRILSPETGVPTNPSSLSLQFNNNEIDLSCNNCTSVLCTITDLGESSGELVSANFSGIMSSWNGLEYSVEGEFKAIVD